MGTATPLQPGDIGSVAASISVPEAALRAVMEVEANGKAFDSGGHPTFLFEPHLFYKNVPKSLLSSAIKQGLAYPRWKGPGSYPKTPELRWQQFQKAVALDETAAIKSASWGLGQILGSEFFEAGFGTPQELLIAFCNAELSQVQGMANLIKHRGLDADLRGFPAMVNCRHFALRYNGKAYEKNNYHNKLHDAYNRWAARLGMSSQTNGEDAMSDGVLKIGERGPSVEAAQQQLKDKGYSLKVDGIFGGGTRTTVLAWQANNNRPTTGYLSHDDLAFLPNSPQMEVQAERANAKIADLKKDSAIIRQSSTLKKIIGGSVGGLGAMQGADSSGVLDTTQSYVDKAQQASGIVTSVRQMAVDSGIANLIHSVLEYKFLIVCVVAVIGFFIATNIQRKRLEMHQKAEIG